MDIKTKTYKGVNKMTYEDVLTQILHEVSGKPVSEIKDLIKTIRDKSHGNHQLDKELSGPDAEKLIAQLRNEKAGILQWMIRSAIELEKQTGHA